MNVEIQNNQKEVAEDLTQVACGQIDAINELKAAVEQLRSDLAELRQIALYRVVIEGLKSD